MKKKNLGLALSVFALSAFMAACGGSQTSESTAEGTGNSTTESSGDDTTETSGATETEVDPLIEEMENIVVPEVPALEDMGTIELVDLSTISVTTEPMTEVTDEEVETQIDYLLSADLEVVSDAAQEGDTVNIDYTATVDGEVLDDASAIGYDLQLGYGIYLSYTNITDLDTELIGAKAGDELTINVSLPEDYTVLEVVDEEAENGDTVNIDFVGSIDGVEFDGGSAAGSDLELGSGSFIDNFEDQLVGSKAGDQVTVNVTFPSDYWNEEYAGLDAVFEVTVNEVKRGKDFSGQEAVFEVTVNEVKRVPELTDEWVQNYEETEETTAEGFRASIRSQIQDYYEQVYHSNIQSSAMTEIIEHSEINLSDAMKEYGYAYMVDAQLSNYQMYGMDLASLISMYGMTAEEFKAEMEAAGEEYAQQYFVILTIAEDAGINNIDELVEKLAEEESEASGIEYTSESLIEQYGKELVEFVALSSAVQEYIETQIEITVEEVQEEELDLEDVEESTDETDEESEDSSEN